MDNNHFYKLLILGCVCILLAVCGSKENITSTGSDGQTDSSVTRPEGKMIQLIRDPQFQKGFKVTPLSAAIVKGGGGFDKTYVKSWILGKTALIRYGGYHSGIVNLV